MEKSEDKRSVFSNLGEFFTRLKLKYHGERRRFPRNRKVYIAEAKINDEKKFITITNLSKEGIGTCLEVQLKKDTELKITFSHEFTAGEYKGQKINLLVWAKVKWSKPVSEGSKEFDTGLKLEYVPEDMKVYYSALIRELKAD